MITPCIKYCRLKGRECQGCYRTIEQIRNWNQYTDEERDKIISECQTKMKENPLDQ